MKKVAWITDSTCGLSQEYLDKHNIHVLPMSVIVNGISLKEDIDISKEEFYEQLKIHGNGAKTSQPAFGDFVALYEKLKEEYDCGIAVHASSELTGTYQSSISAAEMTGFPVEVIDSEIGSYPLGKMIKRGIELQEKGVAYETIVKTMREYPSKARLYLLPENLEQLKRSGRVSTAASVFASLLHINLILTFDRGKAVVGEKIRTKKKAKNKLYQYIEEAIEKRNVDEICIIHAGDKEEAIAWKKEMEQKHPKISFPIEALVPVAGVHTGHGTIGAGWLE